MSVPFPSTAVQQGTSEYCRIKRVTPFPGDVLQVFSTVGNQEIEEQEEEEESLLLSLYMYRHTHTDTHTNNKIRPLFLAHQPSPGEK